MANAVFYLKKAAASTSDDLYRLELARTLSVVSQYEQSNIIYLKLLAAGSLSEKCCFGLSQNLYFQSDMEHSMYYLNIYMDKYSPFDSDDEEEEYIEIIEENDIYDGYGIVYPLEKKDMTDLINNARSLMKQGAFLKAVKLLKKVPKGNYDYLYAQNNIALSCFFLNDFAGTKHYSEKVLQEDKDNVFALCNLAAMYNYIDEEKPSLEYLNRVLKINVTDMSDLFKIATTLCEMKQHALALKYLNLILSKKPYDTNIMFLTAIAYYNNKNPQSAINMFLQLNKLNENDYAVKYYLKLIRQTLEDKDIEKGFFQPLEYICQIPYGEMVSRIKKVKNLKADDIKKLSENDNFYELCGWCFTLPDYNLCKTLAERLCSAGGKKAEDFLRERLIDPLIDINLKAVIVERLILKGINPPYDISVDYVVKKLNPHILKVKKGNRAVRLAYARAYSRLMTVIEQADEKNIYHSYIKLLIAFKNNPNLTDIKTLAAVIAYNSINKNEKLKNNIISIFNVEEELFNIYLKSGEIIIPNENN